MTRRRVSLPILILFGALCSVELISSGEQTSPRKWQPTRVPANTTFVGDTACAACHQSHVNSHQKSSMALAMESVGESRILSGFPRLTFRSGPYSYEISRRNQESIYTVSDAKENISLPVRYVFGQGKAGQTYLIEHDGAFYESRVSFYDEIKGLDITIGQPAGVPGSLKAALGRKLGRDETLKCFSCHATGAVKGGQLHPGTMTPGIRCEACHGPGGPHVSAMKEGRGGPGLIFNPRSLSGDELTQDFCASCHRIDEEQKLLRSLEINNVRYQPYRIFQSPCYSDDSRISCIACHNPHESVRQDASYYDSKCTACHQPSTGSGHSARLCKVGTKDCASCHMPRVSVPQAHFKFTDHYIRVVKPNETYPK